MIKNQGIFDKKNTFDRSKFWKFEFFEKLSKIMQKHLNPSNFMNEMHQNEFKSFSKTLVFNPKLQNKVLNHQKHNFCQPLTIFASNTIENIILDGQTKFTHNSMYKA